LSIIRDRRDTKQNRTQKVETSQTGAVRSVNCNKRDGKQQPRREADVVEDCENRNRPAIGERDCGCPHRRGEAASQDHETDFAHSAAQNHQRDDQDEGGRTS
jgi:hypothetical protein